MSGLRARDRQPRRSRDNRLPIRAVDISAPDFDAARHGFTPQALDAAMHVRLGDGRVVRGMPALRAVYGAAGLSSLVAPTAHPLLVPAFDAAYAAFARHRHAISRTLSPLVAALRRLRRLPPGAETKAKSGRRSA